MRPLSLSDQVSFLLKAWFNMKSFAFVGAGSEQCADICESEFFCIHSVFCSLVHFRYKTFADNIESYLDPARMLFDLNTHLIHYDATRNPRWLFYWWLHHSSCEYLLAKIIFPPAKIICPPACQNYFPNSQNNFCTCQNDFVPQNGKLLLTGGPKWPVSYRGPKKRKTVTHRWPQMTF